MVCGLEVEGPIEGWKIMYQAKECKLIVDEGRKVNWNESSPYMYASNPLW